MDNIVTINNVEDLLETCKKIRETDTVSRYKIIIKESEVFHDIKFPYSNFDIIGENQVKITFNKYSRQTNKDGKQNTTWRTATFTLTGNNNTFTNITFKNSAWDCFNKGQEVSLGIYGNNNKFYNCKIISTQDSLFIGPLPDDLVKRYLDFIPEDERYIEGNLFSYFKNCYICGTIDFIFGAGQAYFNSCQIESIEDGSYHIGYISAPAHSLKDPFGFLFYKCNFFSNYIFQKRVYLARPWRDFGKSAFIDCQYGQHIYQEGFVNWENTFRYLTARFLEYPKQNNRVFFSKQLDSIPKIYSDCIEKFEKEDK